MKLQLLSEGCPRAILIEEMLPQQLKNLRHAALNKVRRMLGPMGLVKGGDIQKHRATEPVHDRDISNAFFALRSAVGNKVDSHIAQYQNRMMPIGRLAEYWGYRFTPEYEAGPTADGVIDQKIRETIMAAKNQPSMEGKAQIIQGLADWVSR